MAHGEAVPTAARYGHRPFVESSTRSRRRIYAQDLFDPPGTIRPGAEIVPGGILTSRGCPARCTFCANYVTGRAFRYRSRRDGRRRDERLTRALRLHFFPCWDDALTANRPRLYELCADDRARDRVSVRVGAITRANMVDPELLAAMRRAGLDNVNFGVESGDDDILARSRRAYDRPVCARSNGRRKRG